MHNADIEDPDAPDLVPTSPFDMAPPHPPPLRLTTHFSLARTSLPSSTTSLSSLRSPTDDRAPAYVLARSSTQVTRSTSKYVVANSSQSTPEVGSPAGDQGTPHGEDDTVSIPAAASSSTDSLSAASPSHPSRRPSKSNRQRGGSPTKQKRHVPTLHINKLRKRVVKGTTQGARQSLMLGGSIINDFKEFILRGNVVDLAIGIIIGGAFTAIVTSLVTDIIGPIVGLALGSQLQNAFVLLRKPDSSLCTSGSVVSTSTDDGTTTTSTTSSASGNGTTTSTLPSCSSLKTPSQVYAAGGVTWNYGNFFQTVIN
ncbi:hypothetical protein HKX48_002975, partial [Thoreauomyces humboldtii]